MTSNLNYVLPLFVLLPLTLALPLLLPLARLLLLLSALALPPLLSCGAATEAPAAVVVVAVGKSSGSMGRTSLLN